MPVVEQIAQNTHITETVQAPFDAVLHRVPQIVDVLGEIRDHEGEHHHDHAELGEGSSIQAIVTSVETIGSLASRNIVLTKEIKSALQIGFQRLGYFYPDPRHRDQTETASNTLLDHELESTLVAHASKFTGLSQETIAGHILLTATVPFEKEDQERAREVIKALAETPLAVKSPSDNSLSYTFVFTDKEVPIAYHELRMVFALSFAETILAEHGEVRERPITEIATMLRDNGITYCNFRNSDNPWILENSYIIPIDHTSKCFDNQVNEGTVAEEFNHPAGEAGSLNHGKLQIVNGELQEDLCPDHFEGAQNELFSAQEFINEQFELQYAFDRPFDSWGPIGPPPLQMSFQSFEIFERSEDAVNNAPPMARSSDLSSDHSDNHGGHSDHAHDEHHDHDNGHDAHTDSHGHTDHHHADENHHTDDDHLRASHTNDHVVSHTANRSAAHNIFRVANAGQAGTAGAPMVGIQEALGGGNDQPTRPVSPSPTSELEMPAQETPDHVEAAAEALQVDDERAEEETITVTPDDDTTQQLQLLSSDGDAIDTMDYTIGPEDFKTVDAQYRSDDEDRTFDTNSTFVGSDSSGGENVQANDMTDEATAPFESDDSSDELDDNDSIVVEPTEYEPVPVESADALDDEQDDAVAGIDGVSSDTHPQRPIQADKPFERAHASTHTMSIGERASGHDSLNHASQNDVTPMVSNADADADLGADIDSGSGIDTQPSTPSNPRPTLNHTESISTPVSKTVATSDITIGSTLSEAFEKAERKIEAASQPAVQTKQTQRAERTEQTENKQAAFTSMTGENQDHTAAVQTTAAMIHEDASTAARSEASVGSDAAIDEHANTVTRQDATPPVRTRQARRHATNATEAARITEVETPRGKVKIIEGGRTTGVTTDTPRQTSTGHTDESDTTQAVASGTDEDHEEAPVVQSRPATVKKPAQAADDAKNTTRTSHATHQNEAALAKSVDSENLDFSNPHSIQHAFSSSIKTRYLA